MSTMEEWGTFLAIIFLVWSTDIVDWICDKIEDKWRR